MAPMISVIMPVYNGEKYLREAIESILSQTYGNFEFIIIDDASKDESVSIVREYDDDRIKLFENDVNMGVAATLNKGIDLAKGKYIARMDCDDISMPNRFEKQIEYMESHTDTVICGSSVNILTDGVEIFRQYSESDGAIRADMIFNSAFVHPAVMIRSDVLKEHNIRYDTEYERAEDYEMWSRIIKMGECCNIRTPLLKYRHHTKQVTQTQKELMFTMANRVRQKMLNDMNVCMNETERKVFFNVCNGERNFSPDDYKSFVSGGKKLISAMNKGKKELRKIYSVININIKLNSDIRSLKFFSIKEPFSMLRCLIIQKLAKAK